MSAHESLGVGGVSSGPHAFQPLRRWFNRGRCRACYVHEHAHPLAHYTPSRPLGDKALPNSVTAILGGSNG